MKMLLTSALAAVSLSQAAFADGVDISGSVAAENRVFFERGALPGQLQTYQGSLEFELDARWTSPNRRWDFVFVPFGRLDGRDGERTHFDAREAYVRWNGDSVTVRAGYAKVFWGVAESLHLVDIINQSDSIEDIDNEDKLGQLMLEVEVQQDWGQITGYVLPSFRKRTSAGNNGRLRLPLPVDDSLTRFDQGRDEGGDIDFALRYSHYFGNWDVGLSFFSGASRDPRFVVDPALGVLAPFYDDITQVGVDLQYTNEAWLWKFEGIVRDTPFETFVAGVGGLEYSFYGVTEAGADLGIILELQYDSRSSDPLLGPLSPADNDLVTGFRYSLNDVEDTALLAGITTDLDDGSLSGFLEASRRIGDNWTAELEGRFFLSVDPENLIAGFSRDSHVIFRLTRYF